MIQVWYHAACNDGFCAAWLLHRRYPSAKFVPVQYGQPMPEVSDTDIILIVDFSYPKEMLEELHQKVKGSLIVMDHHATCPEGLGYVIRDPSRSGAQIVADRYGLSHWLVDYTADRDLWKWALLDSREVNAGLRFYDMQFDVWDGLVFEEVREKGRVLCSYLDGCLKGALKHCTWWRIGDHRLYGCNCTNRDLISDLAGAISEKHGVGFTFFIDAQGMLVGSLRGSGALEIAKSLGGGGHPRAAGFRVSLGELKNES